MIRHFVSFFVSENLESAQWFKLFNSSSIWLAHSTSFRFLMDMIGHWLNRNATFSLFTFRCKDFVSRFEFKGNNALADSLAVCLWTSRFVYQQKPQHGRHISIEFFEPVLPDRRVHGVSIFLKCKTRKFKLFFLYWIL